MAKYISKADEWFDEGTEAELLFITTEDAGLFRGIRNGSIDEEMCLLEEFIITEEN